MIINGETTPCYDGKAFFSTTHSEGKSGDQSNLINIDISTLPTKVHGSKTTPSIEEMQQAILKGVAQLLSFKDDQGEPLNENAHTFMVMVPISLYLVATKAIALPSSPDLNTQGLPEGLQLKVVSNARLTWDDSFVVFRTDGSVKAFIRQEETEVVIKAKAEDSEFEFDNDAHQYGVDAWRNVGSAYWQHAVKCVMV